MNYPNKKITEICSRNIHRKENEYNEIFKLIDALSLNDFPNKTLNCNEPEEALMKLKDLLKNEKRESQVEFDLIYCLNNHLDN